MENSLQHEFEKFLDEKFSDNLKEPLGKLAKIRTRYEVPDATLVVAPLINGNIQFKISDENFPSSTLYKAIFLRDYRVTNNYLLWYFSFEPVKNLIASLAKGSIVPIIESGDLENILIPIPKKYDDQRHGPFSEEALIAVTNPFRKLIGLLHDDFVLNFKEKRFITASILAGAISEAILYKILVDYGIEENLLRGATSGTLIKYIKLLKLDENLHFSLSPFESIQRIRNKTVHAEKAVKLINAAYTVSEDDLKSFDEIVRHFGL